MNHPDQDSTTRPVAQPAAERGSALIISLMVTVILTMLGITFLVLSEQEERISVNSRDHAQALYMAEAAVEVAKTWFNDPSAANLFKPGDTQMNLTLRKGATFEDTSWSNELERALPVPSTHTHTGVDGAAGNRYTGGTLSGNGASKFDKPFRGNLAFGFWGRQDTPDVLLCGDSDLDVDQNGSADCTNAMITWMTSLNNAVRMSTGLQTDGHSTRDFGTLSIEQIRVYRPPIDFDLNTRYGIATIEAVAVKRVRNQIVARRTVREVLQEVPYPGPSGAIESEGLVDMGGTMGVHWGSVTSASTTGMMMFPNGGGNVFDIAVPRSSAARWGYHYTLNPAAHTNLKTSPVTVGVTVTALTELSGVTRNGASVLAIPTPGAIFSDPWLVFKSRNTVEDGNGTPQQWPYSGSFAGRMSGATFSNTPLVNRYHYFQRQIVRFPPMDYQTWKDVSQSGQQGMHYFKHVAGTSYKEDGAGAAQSFIAWLQQYDRGIFFFDTTNSVKPAANGSNLTPGHAWSPGTYVEGFIYLNSSSFSPTGNGNGSTVACASPGEPFLDDGIDLHPTGQQIGDNCLCMRYDEEEGCVLGARPIRFRLQLGGVSEYCSGIDADDCACPPNVLDTMDNATSQREAETFRNGIWDSDIDNDGTSDAGSDIATLTGWTRWIADNNATAGAGVLRDGHGYRAGALPYYPDGQRGAQGQATDPTPIPNAPFDGLWDWKRDVRFLNNIADFGGTAGDRQPHEPFINFKPSHAAGNVVGDPGNREQQVDWRASGHVVEQNLAGAAVRWTTRSRDATGPMYNLDLAINGVIYIEGLYDGAGNFSVYGSVLAKQGFTANGTPNIWFNEALVKGGFPDPKWKLPRVYSSGRDTN